VTGSGQADRAPGTEPPARIPRTDEVLARPELAAALGRLGRPLVREAVRAALAQVRAGELDPGSGAVAAAAAARLPEQASSLRSVLNATGVVVHTNLGRAPLSAAAVAALVAAAGYTDVELDLATGTRGRRGAGALAALRARLPAGCDVMVVNNGAAALLLAVTALAAGREVVWSRGEMVEIGDGFRLPDLVASAGARVREVGTTNRTTVADYAAALGPQTGCLLKVHPSNFVVSGFTSGVQVAELAELGVPVVVDVGSGLLGPEPLLPDEPSMTTALQSGASLVTGSGDKLLGGPQAGVVAGDPVLVAALRRHPMARALRVDKLTLAALEATVTGPPPPVLEALRADPAGLRIRAERLAAEVGPPARVVPAAGVVGGGGAPGLRLDGWAVALPADWAVPLRTGRPPVLGRVHDGLLLLDLRAVPPERDGELFRAVHLVRGPVLSSEP
jgi:L-seryl-tRNA(Ser) seleniumtransferase